MPLAYPSWLAAACVLSPGRDNPASRQWNIGGRTGRGTQKPCFQIYAKWMPRRWVFSD
jgi:hypothetical protein